MEPHAPSPALPGVVIWALLEPPVEGSGSMISPVVVSDSFCAGESSGGGDALSPHANSGVEVGAICPASLGNNSISENAFSNHKGKPSPREY